MHLPSIFRRFRAIALIALLLAAPVALAGPPLLCHPFDTAGAPSLPWGKGGWNTPERGYDRSRLAAQTEVLLGAEVPVIARMETLRRAAIYAGADAAALRTLSARLDARIAAARGAQARALALFDAGYLAETLQDVQRLQRYDMPGIGPVDAAALRTALAKGDGSVRIAQAVALRPHDASLRFASALVASADEREGDRAVHARLARSGTVGDRLLALNIAKIAD